MLRSACQTIDFKGSPESDDNATDEKVSAFCNTYQAALAGDVKSRPPQTAPAVTASLPQCPKRGIQRLH